MINKYKQECTLFCKDLIFGIFYVQIRITWSNHGLRNKLSITYNI